MSRGGHIDLGSLIIPSQAVYGIVQIWLVVNLMLFYTFFFLYFIVWPDTKQKYNPLLYNPE